MANRKFHFLLFSLLASVAHAGAMNSDQALAIFTRANKAYEAGDFMRATAGYDSIGEDYRSFEVYFNAGNAYYRLNRAAPCIWNYEMAYALNPRNEDLLNNRKVAQKLLTDKIEELPVLATDRFITRLSSPRAITVLAGIAAFFMAMSGVFIIMAFRSPHRRAGLTLVSLLFIGSAIGIHFFAKSMDSLADSGKAVIWTDRVEVKTSPNGTENAFVLHEGTIVNVLRKEGDFREVRLANGHVGWLHQETVKLIRT